MKVLSENIERYTGVKVLSETEYPIFDEDCRLVSGPIIEASVHGVNILVATRKVRLNGRLLLRVELNADDISLMESKIVAHRVASSKTQDTVS
jgi:hypothetical protein